MDESFEHQEARGRQHLDFRAVLVAALAAGGVTFIMSGGAPWTTAGTMNAVMGRHFELPVIGLAALHLTVAIIYATVIGAFVYRLKLIPSLCVGALVSMGFYAISYALFHNFSVTQAPSPEVQAAGAHFTFGLLAAAIYRGACLPRRAVDFPSGPRPNGQPSEDAKRTPRAVEKASR